MPLSTEDFIEQVKCEIDYRYESYSFAQNSKDLAFAQWLLELLFPKIDTDLAFSLLIYDEVRNIRAGYKDDESGTFHIIFCHYSEEPIQQKFGEHVIRDVIETYHTIDDNADSLLNGESVLSDADKSLKEGYVLNFVLALFGELEDTEWSHTLSGGQPHTLSSGPERDKAKLVLLDYNQLRRASAGVSEDIPTASVNLTFTSATKYNGPVEALIGNVSASNLKESLAGLVPEVYDANLRVPLGLTKINKAMRRTIASESEFFWYYNNGVTILCRGFSRQQADSDTYVVESPRIVNGAQTIDTILSSEHRSDDEARVLVRIIAALPGSQQVSSDLLDREEALQDLYLNIARFTNSQNPIETPDFRSNETVQKRLHQEFKELGWFYEHRRGQWHNFDQKDTYRNQRIQMVDLAQRWFAFSGRPSVAIVEKYSLFDEQGYYNSIFMLARSAEEYLIAYSIFDQVLQKLKQHIREAKSEEQQALAELQRMPLQARYYLMIGRATKLTAAHMTALIGAALQKHYGTLDKKIAQRIMRVVLDGVLIEKVYLELEDTFFRFLDRIASDKYLTMHRVLSKEEALGELMDLFEYSINRERDRGRDVMALDV